MSRKYSKILVCAENSPYAEKALKDSCLLTRQYGSKLYVIYVVDNPNIGKLGIQLLDRSEFVKMFKNYGEKVLDNAKKICHKNDVRAKYVMKEGNVANEILQYAKKEGIDLIVIGSRGLSRLPRYVLGSTSNKIVNYAHCSVLVVK